MATQAMTAAADNRLSIGTVFSRAFGVMGDNPVATFGIAFLFGALPQQLFAYALRDTMRTAGPGALLASGVLGMGSMIVFLLLYMLVQGALVRATVAYSQGERASFGQSVAVGLSRAVPLIGLSILMLLALMLGFAFFLIPGIMLFVMWSVAGPALVEERIGIFAAFGRSRALTKGARWKIFGLYLVIWVLMMLLAGVSGVLTVALGGAQSLVNGNLPVPMLIFQTIVGTITTALMGTVVTSLYVSLRDWKDGPQAEALADIFA